jgi:dTDP-4-amino-4,6-dideoxygalactose transaminase
MMKIPLIKADLPPFEAIEASYREILESGKITNFGKYVTQFEEAAAAYLGTQVATVSSGTMGLVLALQALGVKPGLKVILPSFTFMATAQAVLYAGGIPVFAEIEDDMTLSPADLEELLNRHKDVAVVIPVHMYGLPCRVEEIQQIVDRVAKKSNRPVAVMYDAAHAFGSARGGRRVGGFGNAEVFSLSVTKALVSVEGGMISSHDAEFIGRVRKMRNYGIEENYNAGFPGFNGKMSEFHAVIGLYNLRRIDVLMAERERKARYLLDRIANKTGFQNMPWPKGIVHTFKDVTVLVPQRLAEKRDAVMNFLKEQGVDVRSYFYPPVHEQKFFRRYSDRPLPRTETLSRKVITLPFYASITENEMDYIVDILQQAEKKV